MAEIFRRVEKKYLIHQKQYEALLEKMKEYMREDRYGKSTICNIYFDSDGYELISHSIEKPFYKEKVRVRSYNVPTEGSKVYLEIKRKWDGVVGKRRIEMSIEEFEKYCQARNSFKSTNAQIQTELEYCFSHYQLKPAMFISYEREAYYGKEDSEFRVTFDHHILARQEDLSLRKGAYGESLLQEDEWIMEVKTLESLPLWFVKALNELAIKPGSFSKYGTAYERMVLNHVTPSMIPVVEEKGEGPIAIPHVAVAV